MEHASTRPERGILLNVSFAEKDRVKQLGARWDPDMKKWFIPPGLETEPFVQWIVESDDSIKRNQS